MTAAVPFLCAYDYFWELNAIQGSLSSFDPDWEVVKSCTSSG